MPVPRLLVRLWQWWKPIAHRIGEVQARVLLTVLYFVIIGPLLPIFRAKDPLGLRRRGTWAPFHGRTTDLTSARRQ